MRRRIFVLLSLVLLVLVVLPVSTAGAATLGAVTISVAVLQLWVAPLLPLVTEALSRRSLPGWARVLVTAFLASVTAIVSTAIATNFDVVLRWTIFAKIGLALGEAMIGYLVLRSAPGAPLDKVAAVTASSPLQIGPADESVVIGSSTVRRPKK